MPLNYYLKNTLKSAVDELQQAVREGWIGGLEAKRFIHEMVVSAKASVMDADDNNETDSDKPMVTHQGNQNGDHGGNSKKD